MKAFVAIGLVLVSVCSAESAVHPRRSESTRVFRTPRYDRGNLNQEVCQPIDEAAWIWHPTAESEDQGLFATGLKASRRIRQPKACAGTFLRFRCPFDSDGTPFEIDVSGDERFILFLDGKRIARGPNRGWTENWQYQTYRIELAPGSHVFEAVVYRLGPAAPVAQLTCRGGFVLNASGKYDDRLTTGKAAWMVGIVPGTTVGFDLVGHGGQGGRTTSTGAGFDAELPSEWDKAVVVASPIRPARPRFSWGLRRPGWMLYPSEIPDQIENRMRPGSFKTNSAEMLQPILRGNPVVVPAKTKVRAFWDLEDYYCYYPELELSGGSGSKVVLHYAEALVDEKGRKDRRDAFKGRDVDRSADMYDTFVSDGRPDARFTTPWWRCGRWIVMEIETADSPLTIDSLSLVESRYPCEMSSTFVSPDDPALEPIQRICLRAMQCCNHETLMDCPYYEQQMYPADTRVQLLTLTALSSDDRMIRRAMEIYDLARRDDGLVPNNWPTRNLQESQVMSLNYLMMYGDYVRWHNNPAWLKARFPGAMNTLLAMKRQENANGLLEDTLGSAFVDWVREWGPEPLPVGRGEGPGALVNLYYVHAMLSVAELADAVGEPALAAYWREKAAHTGAKIVELFWDPTRGLLADDVRHMIFSEHTQCFAILGNVLTPAMSETAFGHLTDGTTLARTTVYSLHYLFETFYRFGRGDLILERLSLWRKYLEKGLCTTVEDPDLEHGRSDCHAWGAHPIYHLRASVAGIRPSSKCFSSVRIVPSPGNLHAIKATMPHPSGKNIAVDLRFDEKGVVHGSIVSPVTGLFEWKDKKVPIEAGQCVEF